METELAVAFSDHHGSIRARKAILARLQEELELFSDVQGCVTSPEVALIPMGDDVDRGRRGLQVIANTQALAQNDSCDALIGNHELLALNGAQLIRKMIERQIPNIYMDKVYSMQPHGRNGGLAFVKEFGDTLYEGFAPFSRRMSPDGDIGAWMHATLKTHSVQEVGGKTMLYVHAGLPPDIKTREDLERRAKETLAAFRNGEVPIDYSSPDECYDNKLFGVDSVFWNRQIARKQLTENEIETRLDDLEVDYLVIGHTYTNSRRIEMPYRRVINIDVGVTMERGNQAAALVTSEEGIDAVYTESETERLVRW